jgi:branched-chain amino acid transport system permease protein
MDLLAALQSSFGELITAGTAAFVLCAIGLAIHFGFTGLLNFGQAAFAAVGAYGYAIASLDWQAPLVIAVLFGLFCAVVFAVLLGIPTLRLRADYLAIVTIAAAQVVKFVATSSAITYPDGTVITGGAEGLSEFGGTFYSLNPIPAGDYRIFGNSLTQDQIWVDIVGWVLVVICALFTYFLTRSPWGRALKGIREDEDAVRSLGKNVYVYKMQALILGGCMAALGGMVFVMNSQTVQPTVWGTNFTFTIWTVLLLGGATTVLGPIVGGIVFFALFAFIQKVLEGMVALHWLGTLSIPQVGQIRLILVGLALMLLVIFRPQGLFGNKKETLFNG